MAETPELNLTARGSGGDDNGGGDDGKPAGGGKKRSSGSSGSRKGVGGRPSNNRIETEIRVRVGAVLERVAEQRDGREDEELAAAIREDRDAIAGAVASMTKPFGAGARQLVLAVLAVIEPVLAFGRLTRIITGRLRERRERIAIERQAAEYERALAAEHEQPGEPPPA